MRISFIALVVAFLAATVAALTPAEAVAAVPSCDWAQEYTRTLAELHEDTALWTVADLGAGNFWGLTSIDTGRVTVSTWTPCARVADVVHHEHMHVQQHRMFGTDHFAALVLGADRIEITADCGSLLLGSRYTPYVQLAGGCSARDLRDARQLISAG